MNLIAAVDRNWAIGCKNELLNSIPEDMQFFRKKTTGNIVVMGRRTLESFPNARPLPKRTNIVITHNPDYEVRGAEVVHSVEEAMALLKQYESDSIFVIGGESIYRQMLPYCDTAYITKMDYAYAADAWFPNLDEAPDWEMVNEGEERTYFDIPYTFTVYKRK